MSWADDYGDACDWYYGNEPSCGSYGNGAYSACCACGGGSSGSGGWSDSDSNDSCEDDWGWADSYGDQCDWYYGNEDSCGVYGEGAWDSCCACGGGMSSGGGWDDAFDDLDWEWMVDEGQGWVDEQGDQSWSVGPVTVTYDSAAAKIAATLSAAALAVALVY